MNPTDLVDRRASTVIVNRSPVNRSVSADDRFDGCNRTRAVAREVCARREGHEASKPVRRLSINRGAVEEEIVVVQRSSVVIERSEESRARVSSAKSPRQRCGHSSAINAATCRLA